MMPEFPGCGLASAATETITRRALSLADPVGFAKWVPLVVGTLSTMAGLGDATMAIAVVFMIRFVRIRRRADET